MTIDTVEQLDEMRARACAVSDDGHDEYWRGYLDTVRAIRAADDNVGLVTVPKNPTEDMVINAACALDRPNIYMGGPSPYNRNRAKLAYIAMIEEYTCRKD